MADAYIGVTPGIGANLQTFQNTIGGNTVEAEAIALVDSTGTEKATTTNPLSVQSIGSSSLTNGQVTVGTSSVGLSSAACRKITIKANDSNTANIYIGNSSVSTANGLILGPGESIGLEVTNANLIFLISSAAGQGASWLAY